MRKYTIEEIKKAAEILVDNHNIEYSRGVCELIADLDEEPDVEHGERAQQISKELGLSIEMY